MNLYSNNIYEWGYQIELFANTPKIAVQDTAMPEHKRFNHKLKLLLQNVHKKT